MRAKEHEVAWQGKWGRQPTLNIVDEQGKHYGRCRRGKSSDEKISNPSDSQSFNYLQSISPFLCLFYEIIRQCHKYLFSITFSVAMTVLLVSVYLIKATLLDVAPALSQIKCREDLQALRLRVPHM